MSRPTVRQTPTLEFLEKREVLSGPSADAQYMLELVNFARSNPAAAAEKVTSNLDANDLATIDYYKVNLGQEKQAIASIAPKQPLAWNDQLAKAATGQSQDQANTGIQTHSGSDGSDLNTRLNRVGYKGAVASSENAFAYASSVDEAIKAFLIDWGVDSKGHRKNILQPDATSSTSYNEVGIGIVSTNNKGLGPKVITQNFARRDKVKAYLLGVAYDDPSGKNFYAPGNGRSGITVEAKNLASGQVSSTQTWEAGGYQMNLDPGNYQVTAKQGNKVIRRQQVSIGSDNVKVDFDLGKPWDSSSDQAPAATPQPAKSQVSTATTFAAAATTPTQVKAVDETPAPVTPPVTKPAVVTIPTVNSRTLTPETKPAATPTVNTSFFNSVGWITSWSSWKATNRAL